MNVDKAINEIQAALCELNSFASLIVMPELYSRRHSIERVVARGETFTLKLKEPIRIEDKELVGVLISPTKASLYFNGSSGMFALEKEL